MKVSVYDTYVPRDGSPTMHFDILVEESATTNDAFRFGQEYLAQKGLVNQALTTSECKFCHMEIAPEAVETTIEAKGYYIIEMENCD